MKTQLQDLEEMLTKTEKTSQKSECELTQAHLKRYLNGEVDFIDESEVLTPADEAHHIDKHRFKIPFVCGARNLGEALRRCAEGAAMIRTKGEAGTGDIIEAVRHMRSITSQIKQTVYCSEDELYQLAKEWGVSVELLRSVKEHQKLPVPNFSAGGIATPADAALMMQLGAESVFVGSGIFKSSIPDKTAKAMVDAVLFCHEPGKLAEISRNLGGAMSGINVSSLEQKELLSLRGW